MSSLPAGLLLFDTGIYIRFSRGGKYLWLGEDARIFQRTILIAVVVAELYAGTHSIASEAVRLGATLVTENSRDFARVRKEDVETIQPFLTVLATNKFGSCRMRRNDML